MIIYSRIEEIRLQNGLDNEAYSDYENVEIKINA
jgi:hypothetical protein